MGIKYQTIIKFFSLHLLICFKSIKEQITYRFYYLGIKIFKKSKLRNCLYGIVKSSGDLESRKGVHIEQKIKLSCVSEKILL